MSVTHSLLLKIGAHSAPPDATEDDLLLTRSEVAQLLDVSHLTIREYELKGLLPPAKLNGRGGPLFSWPTLRTTLREAVSRNFVAAFGTAQKRGPARHRPNPKLAEAHKRRRAQAQAEF